METVGYAMVAITALLFLLINIASFQKEEACSTR